MKRAFAWYTRCTERGEQVRSMVRVLVAAEGYAMVRFTGCAPFVVRERELERIHEAPRTCAAGKDGDCIHRGCPQLRDGEPGKSGRHCPLGHGGGGLMPTMRHTRRLKAHAC